MRDAPPATAPPPPPLTPPPPKPERRPTPSLATPRAPTPPTMSLGRPSSGSALPFPFPAPARPETARSDLSSGSGSPPSLPDTDSSNVQSATNRTLRRRARPLTSEWTACDRAEATASAPHPPAAPPRCYPPSGTAPSGRHDRRIRASQAWHTDRHKRPVEGQGKGTRARRGQVRELPGPPLCVCGLCPRETEAMQEANGRRLHRHVVGGMFRQLPNPPPKKAAFRERDEMDMEERTPCRIRMPTRWKSRRPPAPSERYRLFVEDSIRFPSPFGGVEGRR